MYSKILIPLDGSKFAEAVLPYARMLAQEITIPVDLLYVNDPQEPPAFAPSMANEYLTRIGESFGTGFARLSKPATLRRRLSRWRRRSQRC